jgi:hypothetical protein
MLVEHCLSSEARSSKGEAGAVVKSLAEVCESFPADVDYSRGGPGVSLSRSRLVSSRWNLVMALTILAGLATGAMAQYPGRVTKTDKKTPMLRSVAVLEWTGDPGKPSASRLVPVAVYDGEQLNDGTIYLSRPEPLALASGVEYELQKAGNPVGIFDVFAAGEVNGGWQGFGAWKPLTAPEAAKAKASFNTSTLYGQVDAPEDDHPVLKRKHPKETDSDDGSGSGASGNTQAKSPPAPGGSGAADPDRPTLKRKSGDDAGASGSSGAGSSSASTAPVDPDRPTLHRTRHSADAETETSTAAPDPDRPRLKHGKPADLADAETPKLMGLPPTMQQAVAVSDASNHAEHPWKYSWANLDDESKMKAALEDIARTALGLDTPPAPTAKSARKTPVKKTPLVPPTPPPPAELADEQFRVFELAYGASATMVLTASTPLPPAPNAMEDSEPAPPVIKRGKPAASSSTPLTQTPVPPKAAPQKFVTLVAQPDLYGGVMVLFKSVTDAAHLDDRPRMTLVDAVDAMADNRGELLFELRGKTQRQFALFRVLRGSAEQMFATVAIP